jgi:hypothetical protein
MDPRPQTGFTMIRRDFTHAVSLGASAIEADPVGGVLSRVRLIGKMGTRRQRH